MASLIEELIMTLEEEETVYQKLIPINEDKTKIIINNDLDALQKITDQEQSMILKINVLEHKRQEVLINIGTVINRNPSTLDLKTMVKLLEKQPEEQKKLSQIHDNLKRTIGRLMELNHQNQSLIEQSLELIEFNMNFIQSTRMSPGNNYNKNASGIDLSIEQNNMFDTKQ
ncbi:MAG: flagellar protein FlgN [Velocimicrobium sp.]